MNPLTQVSLQNYSTMRLGGSAAYVFDVHSRMELTEALQWAEVRQLPAIMVGGGSNIFWRDEGFGGVLLVNKIDRFEVFDEDGSNVYITVGAGELWDSVVKRTVEAGLSGVEYLSLIPGTAGATPIQNVGAYGHEIADTLVTVEAYDSTTRGFVTIAAADCAFGYRTSRFKSTDKGRFYITALTLHLMRTNPEPPFYAALDTYLSDHKITSYTPAIVRNAVVDIRTQKLPDPAQIANCGSFFSNPIIDDGMFTQLTASYGEIPHWPLDTGRVKVSAAWLIDRIGFKNYHDAATGIATWQHQPLVLINEHARSTGDLLKFRDKIVGAVKAGFGITLEQEPELLP